MNGDTPVLFGADGPDMGGFSNILAVIGASMWKVGQMKSGDTVQFVLVNANDAKTIDQAQEQWVSSSLSSTSSTPPNVKAHSNISQEFISSATIHREGNIRIAWAGDEFMIFELGQMTLDLSIRLQVEMWEREVKKKNVPGIDYFNTCIRSSVLRFDPKIIDAAKVAQIMLETAKSLPSVRDIELPITIHKMPVVVDDPWTKEATEYYMRTARKDAIYLPNNGKYVARNNGRPPSAVADAINGTPWLVVATGFFLALPFVIVSPFLVETV